jgi:uncharacterized membrane protein HdeD (DUF308 family)
MKNKLTQYKRTLKEIFKYSDNELLDIALSLVFLFINPFTMYRVPDTPTIWAITSILGGLLLFMGVLERHLSFRYWGNRIGWLFSYYNICPVCLVLVLVYRYFGYVIQLILVWYSMWRTKKQIDFYNTRKK